MKNVLSLNSKDARDFFLKEESYFNFDLPPYFKFEGLLIDISKKLAARKLSDFTISTLRPTEVEGVNYTLISNKDGRYAWRPLQLIHPAIYVNLVSEITEKKNWAYIVNRLNQLIKYSSEIKCESWPIVTSNFKKDKAGQIVHWSEEVERKSIIYSLEYDYLFHTDITDCYGSIYTHSIAWALHDKSVAKVQRKDKSLIGNIIDMQLQSMSYGQTNGISQGSVLMDFIAEIVLCYIDSLLTNKIKQFRKIDYKIIRYRDDYRIFSNNPQIAECIIKELTDILNDFGMKINSSKTVGVNDSIHSSVKEDKLSWMIQEKKYENLQHELFAISIFAKEFPNSGMVVKRLTEFYNKISELTKKEIRTNIKVLISIVTEIAYKNPRTYPIASAILSQLIDILPKSEKGSIIKKILNKFKKLPNTGIMQLWLQRITIKTPGRYDYTEKLCNKVVDSSIIIWNSDWLNASFRNIINSYKLIDQKIFDTLGVVISTEEFSLFDRQENSL